MTVELEAWIALSVAAAVTFATRALGPVLMTRVPSTKRVQRFLDSLSTSVIVAIVAGFLARGTLREAAAIAAGALGMVLFQRPLLSMAMAVVVAAAWTGYPR